MKTIVDKFEYGEIATIRNYNIFNPTPNAWNTDYNGIGKEYKPDDEYVMSSDLYLYGQYQDSFVNYYYFDRTVDKWQTRFGTMIIVGNCLSNNVPIADFKCWLCDGNEVFANQYYTLSTFNLEFFPSCCTSVQLSFNSNGGKGPDIERYAGNCSNFMRRNIDSIECVTEPFDVELPECTYTKDKYHFNGWKVDGVVYDVGDICHVSKNTEAIVQWQSDKQYVLQVQLVLDNSSDTAYGKVTTTGSVYNKTKTLVAIPYDGYLFDRWTGFIESRANTITITCRDSITQIVAHFKKKIKYILHAEVNDEAYGSTEVEGDDESLEKNVRAIALNSNYKFDHWEGISGEHMHLDSFTYTFDESERDVEKTITAMFILKDEMNIVTYQDGSVAFFPSIDSYADYTLFKIDPSVENYDIVQIALSKKVSHLITSNNHGIFEDLRSLQKVTFNSQIFTIDERSFYNCDALFNDGICDLQSWFYGNRIEQKAFYNCNKIKDLKLPYLIEIEERSFEKCNELKKMTFSNDGVEMIGAYAFENVQFSNCTIDLSKIIAIGANAFRSVQNATISFERCNSTTGFPSIAANSFGDNTKENVLKFANPQESLNALKCLNYNTYLKWFSPQPEIAIVATVNYIITKQSSTKRKLTVQLKAYLTKTQTEEQILNACDWGDEGKGTTTTKCLLATDKKAFALTHTLSMDKSQQVSGAITIKIKLDCIDSISYLHIKFSTTTNIQMHYSIDYLSNAKKITGINKSESNVTRIFIPYTVNEIDDKAFKASTQLEMVDFSSNSKFNEKYIKDNASLKKWFCKCINGKESRIIELKTSSGTLKFKVTKPDGTGEFV